MIFERQRKFQLRLIKMTGTPLKRLSWKLTAILISFPLLKRSKITIYSRKNSGYPLLIKISNGNILSLSKIHEIICFSATFFADLYPSGLPFIVFVEVWLVQIPLFRVLTNHEVPVLLHVLIGHISVSQNKPRSNLLWVSRLRQLNYVAQILMWVQVTLKVHCFTDPLWTYKLLETLPLSGQTLSAAVRAMLAER